ncbi:hypothetical protein [Longispora urticae]
MPIISRLLTAAAVALVTLGMTPAAHAAGPAGNVFTVWDGASYE